MSHTVALLLFEGCDVMDVTGPYEVLLTANRLRSRDGGEGLFDVRTVSVDGAPVTAYGGLGLVPSHGPLADHPHLDLLVVPGLIDIDAGVGDPALVGAIADAADRADVIGSVCTGAFLLEAAGLLGERPATTHWEDVPLLLERRADGGSDAPVRDDVRWVDAGDVVTAGGLTDGIAMALHLVERYGDRELAERTALQLDFPWTEDR